MMDILRWNQPSSPMYDCIDNPSTQLIPLIDKVEAVASQSNKRSQPMDLFIHVITVLAVPKYRIHEIHNRIPNTEPSTGFLFPMAHETISPPIEDVRGPVQAQARSRGRYFHHHVTIGLERKFDPTEEPFVFEYNSRPYLKLEGGWQNW